MVELAVVDIAEEGAAPPPGVVGGPTAVFHGTIVALGTPDCSELADRLEALVGARG